MNETNAHTHKLSSVTGKSQGGEKCWCTRDRMIPPHTHKKGLASEEAEIHSTQECCEWQAVDSCFPAHCRFRANSHWNQPKFSKVHDTAHEAIHFSVPHNVSRREHVKVFPGLPDEVESFVLLPRQAVQTNTRAAPTYCLTKLGKVIAAEKRTWTEQAVVYYFKLPNNASDFCTPHCDRFSKVAAGLKENFLRYITFWSQPWSLKQLE